MLLPHVVENLDSAQVLRLAASINESRGSAKLESKDVECLATGIRAILEIVGRPKLLDKLEIDEEFSKKRMEVTFGSPTAYPAEVLVSSTINANLVYSTVGITNKRNDSALQSFIAQVTQDRETKQITGFVACMVTDDTQENDKPLGDRILNKALKALGITALMRELRGIYYDPDTIYTAISYSAEEQQFKVSSKSAMKADVPIPLSLSMLYDVDEDVITERLEEIVGVLLY